MSIEIFSNERVDDLQYKGLRLIQKQEGFCFGVDAVLLANFADVRRGASVIDLGTGTGIISILLAGKTEARSITGLEIQSDMAEMAQRSVCLNKLEDRVKIVNGDIKNAIRDFGASKFDVVVTNPPYINKGGGMLNPLNTKAVSRHEILCTLEDVVGVSGKLLAPGGQLAMVHRPERLVDIYCLMRSNGIEPKYTRFVHPSPGKAPNLVLVKGTRGGKPQMKVLEPLYVYNPDGCYSDEINRIYYRQEAQNKDE